MMDIDDEVNISSNEKESKFDCIVGALEDILMEEQFQELIGGFCDKYSSQFEDEETNKLEYTTLFNEYTRIVEQYIQRRLTERDPSFSMEEFLEMITERQEEITGDVWDVLLSMGDFTEFKCMMLAHKQQMNGLAIDASQFLKVNVFSDK